MPKQIINLTRLGAQIWIDQTHGMRHVYHPPDLDSFNDDPTQYVA